MQIRGYTTRPLLPPQDSLYDALHMSTLRLKEGDIVAISSKIVSIDEGATIACSEIDKQKLVLQEADWFYRAPKSARYRSLFTITKGYMAGSSGIDESNGNGYYIRYPVDPFKSAQRIRAWLRKEYGVEKIAVIITDSASLPLRRGAIGFALAWDGIDPLRDYRGKKDIFGRTIRVEMMNLIDSLATSAVLEMGEGDECKPVAVISDAPKIVFKNRAKSAEQLIVAPEDDIFAPLIWRKGWKRNRST